MTQPWDKYKEIKLEHGKLIDQIKGYQQKHWKKACEKLNLVVSTRNGRGGHIAIFKHNCPPSKRECCILTIPSTLYENIQRDNFKKVLCYGLETKRYNEDDIWEALGVKIK